ncbi:hypothetical protein NG895_27715 [Aeoliella sp. ICT_H6.2]|uniref:Secreted protein with PEP-CTERM sorting signal n=1 Tax=Aeoliella straminimaris TaxID=2954799 RepID=A0A9X2FFC5_9BACT|nr:hypothetical protein [Aeoliella straminimaris]MCO6047709.1 hypothetical protein [Aeoliella straminimaris]
MGSWYARPCLTGLLLFFLASVANAQTPSHDWSFVVGSSRFGLIAFGDITYVYYGFGLVCVPFPPGMVASMLGFGLAIVLAALIFVATRWRVLMGGTRTS